MMRLDVTFPSLTLLRPVAVTVGLPSGFTRAKPPYRVLWALHCAMEGGMFFFNALDAADVVDGEGIAVIAPSLGNGYFLNSPVEAQGDFLQEMRASLCEMLPLSPERKDNAVLGISMGAFGAVRWALESGVFNSVAAISGVFDCTLPPDERMLKKRSQRALYLTMRRRMTQLLLDEAGQTRPEADLPALFRQAAGNFPHIHIFYGEEDYLSLPHSDALAALCARHGCPVQTHSLAGEHNATCWRPAFRNAAAALLHP